MMNKNKEYGFWIWSNKLEGVLHMLSAICNYDLYLEEIDTIRFNLSGTNDAANRWTTYCFDGKKYKLNLSFAYDDAEMTEMIHFRIVADKDINDKLEVLDLFQSLFLELKPGIRLN